MPAAGRAGPSVGGTACLPLMKKGGENTFSLREKQDWGGGWQVCSNRNVWRQIFPCLEKERFMPETHMSSYQTLVGCKPFHPRRVECFQGTEVCLSCSTHTSAPGFDEAFASHATDLDQTYNTISKTCRSRKFSIMTISYIQLNAVDVWPLCMFDRNQYYELIVSSVTPKTKTFVHHG